MFQNSDHDVLIAVKTVVDDIRERLFGDGETGDIPKIARRTSTLEEFKNKLLGAIIILATLTSIIGSTLIYHLFSLK